MNRITRFYDHGGHTVSTEAGSVEASHEAAEWKFEAANRTLPRIGGWVQRDGANRYFWASNPAIYARKEEQ